MDKTKNEKALKYADIIKQMTLEEKASLMSGANFWNTKAIERLGIPGMMLTDGPHGLRKQGGKADHIGLNQSIPATCFPTAATLANSWDVSLLQEVGACLGKEAAAEKVGVLLGPGLNIKRSPLCGRNFEYFSEDPLLAGKLAASMVKGIQSEGASACPKHFAVNSQETNRMTVDEIVDERTLHETYLEGFRYAIVEGGARTVMTSYNKVNGSYANENTHLMQDILHNSWGFDGLVVTDWGGSNSRIDGLVAGNTLEMPAAAGVTDAEIVAAVNSGKIPEALLDERVDTFLSVLYEFAPKNEAKQAVDMQLQHQKAVEAACRSAVLLKNEDGILPLKAGSARIGVIGDFAETPRYQGAGSSLINPSRLDSALEVLQNSPLNIVGFEHGFKRLGKKSGSMLKKAVELAQSSDIVLLFLGLDESRESEGMDRADLFLAQNQLDVLDAVYAANPNIVLILAGGSPVEMPFLSKTKAVLHGYLTGQGGGNAIYKLLVGEHNPSGKLAESYPLSYADVPSAKNFPGAELSAEHRDGIYIGYRYYDTAKKDVLFPFGFGLSYTTFGYSGLEVSENSVSLLVKNTGQVAGEEIVQVYNKANSSEVFRAEKELKGFAKVMLLAGEEKRVEVALDDHAFAFYHIGEKRWVKETGSYTVFAAASSRDLRFSENIEISGEKVVSPYNKADFPSYYSADVQNVPDDEFERLVGTKLPQSSWDRNKPLGYNDAIEQSRYGGRFGRFLYKLLMFFHRFLHRIGKPIESNYILLALAMPFRSMSRMSAGGINYAMLDGILVMVNGSFWKGLSQFNKAKKAKKQHDKQL